MDSIHTTVNFLIFCTCVVAICIYIGLIIWLGMFMWQLHHAERIRNDISIVELPGQSRRGNDLSRVIQQPNEETQLLSVT